VRMDKKKSWNMMTVTRDSGTPIRLNDLMSSRRFELILEHLSYTNKELPVYKYRVWEIRDFVKAWNRNMMKVFSSLWPALVEYLSRGKRT